jgi:hypothetical protein
MELMKESPLVLCQRAEHRVVGEGSLEVVESLEQRSKRLGRGPFRGVGRRQEQRMGSAGPIGEPARLEESAASDSKDPGLFGIERLDR